MAILFALWIWNNYPKPSSEIFLKRVLTDKNKNDIL